MKVKFLLIFIIAFLHTVYSQVITWEPLFPTETDSITVYFHADQGNKGLMNFSGDIYAHTGVITDKSTSGSDWKYVLADWNVNISKAKLTQVGTNLYKYIIKPDPKTFYSVPQNEKVKQIAFVFRSADRTKSGRDIDGKDIFLPIYVSGGLNLSIISPGNKAFIAKAGDTIKIKAVAVSAVNMKIKVNDVLTYQVDNDTLTYQLIAGSSEKTKVKIEASDINNKTKVDSLYYVVNPTIVSESLPVNTIDGLNYKDNSTVTLVLYAPYKKFVYLIGDFNNWEMDPGYFMKRTLDSTRYWITLTNLTPQQEYAYQYYVDGELKIADPYTEKVLDPGNDKFITSITYQDLKPYPSNKTSEIVSIVQTGQVPYQWHQNGFKRPSKSDLVIYELLVRDFTSAHDYKTLKDTLSYLKRLGINAIELMPINEFEGNESWGYNPSFYFAPDKYYGTKDDLKAFIDECHKNGIAVIQDMVLNHSFGQSPMVRLYWDSQNNRPAANNPWFNQIPRHDYNVGYDFNHESPATREFSKRVMKFWLEEYKVDGFRFDLSKGFTQNNTLGNTGAWGQYDQTRVDIWDDYSKYIWGIDSTAYIILEHLADNSEEKVLSSKGMMLWGNMNYAYSQAAQGYNSGTNSDFSGVSYKNRAWQNPHLVGYMESHDEERLMYNNILNGNSRGSYDIQDTCQALNRIKLATAFFLTIPGPKMIWQFEELGYDYTINYNGRIGNKPIRWDYYKDPRRYKLYKVFLALIKLKEENEAFRSSDFALSVSGAAKRININYSMMNVTVIGNFDVVEKTINPNFQNTGTWYDYFSGDSISVTDTEGLINLQPGEFHIYTTKKLPAPGIDILSDVENSKIMEIKDFELEQNYPNPFNPETVINYKLPVNSHVELKVYDILGREVALLINKEQSAGEYKVMFDAVKLSSGMYIYRIQAGNYSASRKMLLVR